MSTSCLILLYIFLGRFVASSKWFPSISAESESHQRFFRLVNFPDLQGRFLSRFVDQLQLLQHNISHLSTSHFQWTSVTMFRESNYAKSWLIAAGSSPKQNQSNTAFTNDFGAVFGCQFDVIPDKPGGFDISTCEILGLDTGTYASNYTDAGILGKGLQSLQLLNGGGVVVFCDPLWHSNQGTRSPGGKCSVLERTNEAWQSAGAVEFCSSAGRTQPCAGGFSIDLRLSEGGTNAQLLAGLPFSQPNRRVRTIDGLIKGAPRHVRDVESKEEGFGTSVAWSPHFSGQNDALAVVGSPSTSVQAFQVNSFADDIDTEVLRITGTAFSSIGFAIETSLTKASIGVFAGAPFEEVEKVGSNAGRLYAQFRNAEGVHNSSLKGSRPGEMFGYAIARVGDIDGDDIDEVAVSAPALDAGNITGRVYIHRVLSDFRLDPEPLQILEAPKNVVGFGISLSRSIDMDTDGGPEFAVTTLDPKVPVLLYSLPIRLRAKCAFKVGSRAAPAALQKGDIVTLSVVINLIDSATGKRIPAHANFMAHSHQINPDVLWRNRYDYFKRQSNQSELLAELLTSTDSFKLDPSQPRLIFEEISDVRISRGGSITLSAKLRAQEDARYMDLDIVPLHVAFRSILVDSHCDQYTEQCLKANYPLIEWSDCVWKMPSTEYYCPPHPNCSADLQLFMMGGGESHTPVQFGRRDDANQTLKIVLRNNGPTKSVGVRAMLSTIGWPKNASRPGLRVLIKSVHLRDVATGVFLASNKRSTDQWSVRLSSNGAAALITAHQGTVMYPDQEICVMAHIFLAGLATTRYEEEEHKGKEEEEEEEEEWVATPLPSPGLLANVYAAVGDPNIETNALNFTFDVIYTPQVRINPGATPPTLVDERKEPPHLTAATKVTLGNEVGPQLEHVFLVENFGKVDLHDITFQLDAPIYTDSGDTLLYLTNRARLLDSTTSDYRWVNTLPKMVSANGSEVGSCVLEEELVNPLNLTIREVGSGKSSYPNKRTNRRRRHAQEDVALAPGRVAFTNPFGDNRVEVYFKRSGQRQTTISCSADNAQSTGPYKNDLELKVICARVICRLGKLQHADTVRVRLTGWLWTPTYFKHQLPDVKFVSKLSLIDWGVRPLILLAYPSIRMDFRDDLPEYELPQVVVFRGVTGKYQARNLLWPIIVGAVLGSILLISMIASLYSCGFFRRRQRTKEAKRKSLIITGGKRGRPPAYTKEDRPATFLLEMDGDRKGALSNARNTDIYKANPLHAGSPDLLYALGPQPPTPLPPEDLTADRQDFYWMREHLVEENMHEAQTDASQVVVTEQSRVGRKNAGDSRDSSAGIDSEWLMSEIKAN